MQRRKFIKKASLISIGLGIANKAYSKNYKKTNSLYNNITPLVIATWDVKNATKKAWKIIQNNPPVRNANNAVFPEANTPINIAKTPRRLNIFIVAIALSFAK